MSVASVAAVVAPAVISGYASSRSAKKASGAQIAADQAAIDEQRRQFDKVMELLSPYSQAGEQALEQQGQLAGLGTPEEEQAAIERLQGSPMYQAMLQEGEEGILQNAAATGGLRGGNIQSALAEFRPQLLSGIINQRYGQLGGIVNTGQASAAGQAASGQQMAGNVGALLSQQGQARAGRYLAEGQQMANVAGSAGQYALLKKLGVF